MREKTTMLLRWFAALSGAWLLFNLVAMPLAWGGINAEGGGQWWVQLVILLGFVVIFIFDLVSAGMILTRACWLRGDLGGERCESGWLVVLAALGVVGLAGAKVMVDEIGRETPLGWGTGGEWVILYICLGLQLAYILAFLFFKRPDPKGANT